MKRRITIWLMIATALVLLVGSAVAFTSALNTLRQQASAASANQQAQQALREGVDLGKIPAPAFSLLDQTGATVSLASLRGHPVVLTFLDSLCPHADCSLMAQYLNATAKSLGQQSAAVSWVAITVNPWRDTPATATAFLQSRQVTMPFHYLLGSPTQLAPIWSAYHMQAILQSDGIVIHTTGVYVLDTQGRERLYLNEGFDPTALGGYLRTMLSGSSQPSSSGPHQSAGTITLSQNVHGASISLTAVPGQYGAYTFVIEALDDQGAPIQNATVTLALTMPAMAMKPLTVTLGPSNPPLPGVYSAHNVLSMVGQWQAIAQVQPASGGAPIRATFTFNSRN